MFDSVQNVTEICPENSSILSIALTIFSIVLSIIVFVLSHKLRRERAEVAKVTAENSVIKDLTSSWVGTQELSRKDASYAMCVESYRKLKYTMDIWKNNRAEKRAICNICGEEYVALYESMIGCSGTFNGKPIYGIDWLNKNDEIQKVYNEMKNCHKYQK
ncbi:hypothetical protein [Aliikangiella coralliicola]|uniref:DUF4760 domain-containing protein n=1 Tax=Aliikangiella coralliicola TaxID=2592383 RepID=A0A545UDN3_9GAMM|nr:hypothetical protein [Aliikangiella coralliicola]TQV87574.1 hypothetical protein FLL46_11930 [Aliikangiella coralliicola]